MTLRVALAGAGMVSRHHLIAWSKLEGARIVAAADPRPEAAAERAAAFAIPETFTDTAAMLDAVKPDAIDIAAPMALHAALAEAAAARGVAILCQKPLAPTLGEAEALVAAIGDRVPFMVHENWRFRPYYRRAREWIRAGRIGRPRAFRMAFRGAGLVPPADGGTPPGLVRQPFFAGMERLIVLELLIHQIDTLRALVGPLTLAAARATRISDRVKGEDTATLLLDGRDGLAGTLTGSMSVHGATARGADHLEILGDTGTITVDDATATLHGPAPEEAVFDRDAAYQGAYDAAIAHFVESLRAGAPFETAPADNLQTLRLVDAAYRLIAAG